jgi:hypothetical protein
MRLLTTSNHSRKLIICVLCTWILDNFKLNICQQGMLSYKRQHSVCTAWCKGFFDQIFDVKGSVKPEKKSVDIGMNRTVSKPHIIADAFYFIF